jgi:hypothetical protein
LVGSVVGGLFFCNENCWKGKFGIQTDIIDEDDSDYFSSFGPV